MNWKSLHKLKVQLLNTVLLLQLSILRKSQRRLVSPSSSCPETCPDMGVNLQCPICLEHFPIKTVEEHAAQCEVAHPSLYQILPEFDGDSDEEDDNDAKKKEFTEISRPSCVLKDMVMNLAVTLFDLEEERVRIIVCRKQVWDDYKRARYYSPEKKIKVTFSGESAIDDGGPRREFFSGIVNIFSLIVQHQKEVRSNKKLLTHMLQVIYTYFIKH